ncbi:MAG: flavodoxin [Clostridiales Family XIII bacterium]|jgi:flavodoxin short chain|nr:flavodoxin [Clostridiales Family XIII bacterium]
MNVAIVYWSGTGNTEAMAKAIERGLKAGGASTSLLSVENATVSVVDEYDGLALGCPSMGDEVLEESYFEPFFSSAEGCLSGKKIALFGSYGWGDGQWMRDWQERTRNVGASLFGEGLIQQYAPDESVCEAFGRDFASFCG